MNIIATTYTDQQLRILIEKFIAMQRSSFTFKEVCSYILYRTMGEGRMANNGIYESNQLEKNDCCRVSCELDKIIAENRIVTNSCILDSFEDNASFVIIVK